MKNEKKPKLTENELNSNAQQSKMSFSNQKPGRSSMDKEQLWNNSEQLKNIEKNSDSPYDIVATSPPAKSPTEIKETTINGNDQPPEIPGHLVKEHRRLKEEKNELEIRRQKLENYNKLLEMQLNQFKQYVNNVDSLDSEVKQKLDQGILETERILQQDKDKLAFFGEMKNRNNVISSGPSASTNNPLKGIILNKQNSTKIQQQKFPMLPSSQAQSFARTYQQPLLHTAADDVNNAVESLVNAFNNIYTDETNKTEENLPLENNCNGNGIETEVNSPETNEKKNMEQLQSRQSYSGKVTHL